METLSDILIRQQVEFSILDRLSKVAKIPETERRLAIEVNRFLENNDFNIEEYIETCHFNACVDAERLLEALEDIRGIA